MKTLLLTLMIFLGIQTIAQFGIGDTKAEILETINEEADLLGGTVSEKVDIYGNKFLYEELPSAYEPLKERWAYSFKNGICVKVTYVFKYKSLMEDRLSFCTKIDENNWKMGNVKINRYYDDAHREWKYIFQWKLESITPYEFIPKVSWKEIFKWIR